MTTGILVGKRDEVKSPLRSTPGLRFSLEGVIFSTTKKPVFSEKTGFCD